MIRGIICQVGQTVVVGLDQGNEYIGTLITCDKEFNIWLKAPLERWDLETGTLVEKEDDGQVRYILNLICQACFYFVWFA